MITLNAIKPASGMVAAAATQQFVLNEISVPVIGAQLTIILAGAIGALASTPYGDPDTKRTRLFGTILVATVMGPVISVLLQHGLEWAWIANVKGALALVISFLIRLWLPAIVERGLSLIKRANPFSWMKTNGDKP